MYELSKEFTDYRHTIKNQGPRKAYWNFNFFKEIASEIKAYWLGIWYGDGSVYKQDGRTRSKLYLNDSGAIQQFAKDIEFTGNYTNEIILFGYPLLEMPRKEIRTFPGMDDLLYRHFIRGLFDADGSISYHERYDYTRPVFTLCHASKILMDVIARKLDTTVFRGHETWQISINGRKRCQRLGSYLYRESTRYFERKINRYRETWKEFDNPRIRQYYPDRLPTARGM